MDSSQFLECAKAANATRETLIAAQRMHDLRKAPEHPRHYHEVHRLTDWTKPSPALLDPMVST